MLASKWKLPERFVRLIRHHTQLDELLAEGPSRKVQRASRLRRCYQVVRIHSGMSGGPFVDGFNCLIAGKNVNLQELFVKVTMMRRSSHRCLSCLLHLSRSFNS